MIDRVFTLTRCTAPETDVGHNYHPQCRQGNCRQYPVWTVSEQKAGYYGRSHGTAASTVRYCADHIYKYLAQNHVIGLPEVVRVSFRDFSIFQRLGEGATTEEVGEEFKLTRQRISQIRRNVGAALAHGGQIEVTK